MRTLVSKFLKRFNLSLANTAAVLLLAGYALAPSQALAEFKVCNKSDTLVGVAVGYKLEEEWITEGWWRIPPNICSSIIEGDLTSRYFYLHAESVDADGKWRGPVFMCTSNIEFKISGVKDCFARGYERTGFFEVDTGEQKSWQVRLTNDNQTKKDDPSK
ncbi:MAG: DUF1036 domain-containing protein [Rhizobiaceae bacterium]